MKIQKFDRAMTNAQNLSNRLTEHGANTASLNQTIDNAYDQIQAFQSAVSDAQNKTQTSNCIE